MTQKKEDGSKRERQAEKGMILQNEELIMKTAAIAYENAMLQEMEELENDSEGEDMSPEAAERLHNSVMQMLADLRKKQMRKFILLRVLQVVVCIVVVLGVGLFVAFQVDASRSGISNFLINTFSQYSEVEYDAQANALPPVGWESPYYPLWLPEGTRVMKITLLDQDQYIWYQDPYGHEFSFAVLPRTSQTLSVDSEGMISKEITVSGQSATLAHSEDGAAQSLTLVTPQNVLRVDGALSESDIVKIAENLSKYG